MYEEIKSLEMLLKRNKLLRTRFQIFDTFNNTGNPILDEIGKRMDIIDNRYV